MGVMNDFPKKEKRAAIKDWPNKLVIYDGRVD